MNEGKTEKETVADVLAVAGLVGAASASVIPACACAEEGHSHWRAYDG